MLKKQLFILFFSLSFLALAAAAAQAQYPFVNSEELRSLLTGKKTVMLIDSRLPEEYESGHIPGAVNIPAERMRVDASRLPKDTTTPIITYCRGAG